MLTRSLMRCTALILAAALITACAAPRGSDDATRAANTDDEATPTLPPTWTEQARPYTTILPTDTYLPMTLTPSETPWPSVTPKPGPTKPPPPTRTPFPTWTPCPPGAFCPTRTPRPTQAGPPPSLTNLSIGFMEVGKGINKPTSLALIPGTKVWAVAQQPGHIVLIEDGILTSTLLDLSEKVNDVDVEMGLLGIVFHPNFASNGAMFVDYTDFDGNILVERYTVRPDRRTADLASAVPVIRIRHIGIQHNGGQLAFGPDGYLYISVGDGGGVGGNQMLPGGPGSTMLGSILRIDVNQAPYVIPSSNPFVSNDVIPDEVWHYGLRNPWRFSFDRRTGEMYIGDVGEAEFEEIDYAPAGRSGLNFGWPVFEGAECYGDATDCPADGLAPPAITYAHDKGCTVVGGYVYRGKAMPALNGVYLYGDFCTGGIWGMVRDGAGWATESLLGTNILLTSFAEDADGELYVTDYGRGRILKMVPAEP